MSNTKDGGARVSQTLRRKYGDDYWKNIGAKGGSKKTSKPKGFAAMPHEKVREAGRLGGASGKRGAPKKV